MNWPAERVDPLAVVAGYGDCVNCGACLGDHEDDCLDCDDYIDHHREYGTLRHGCDDFRPREVYYRSRYLRDLA